MYPLHNRIPPHLTLKRWFESEDVDISELYKNLDTFVASKNTSDYSLSGFGSFRNDVIYIDVKPSTEMTNTVRGLLDSIRNVEGMTFDEYDNGGDFHATVTLGALKPFNFDEVWSYLKTIEQPDFKMKFDNIAVLKKQNDVWGVDRMWEISTA